MNEFYNIYSEQKERELNCIQSLLLQEIVQIDESKCFFINIIGSGTNINGSRLHLRESSLKEKLKRALKNADDLDKLLLGFMYERYSYSSNKIHIGSILISRIQQF